MAENSPSRYRRLGIFGGGFDPVHRGHLLLVSELRDLAHLDHILIVPTNRPPHKPHGFIAGFDARVEMTRLAFTGIEKCEVTEIEQEIDGPCYSLDVVRSIKKHYLADDYCLCLGADQFLDLPRWHRPEELSREVTFCVGQRPGENLTQVSFPFPVKAQIHSTSLLDISASQIRRLLKAGLSESDLAQLVPESVARYIVDHGLYQ